MQAIDIDSSDFGRVEYAIGQSSQFSIGQDNGLIGLSQYNRETDPKFIELSVNATDNLGAVPSFTSTALVKVSVHVQQFVVSMQQEIICSGATSACNNAM